MRRERSVWRSAVTFSATILLILALAVVPLLTPPFVHAALGAAGSARWLGVEPSVAQELSDRSMTELVAGPGTFAFAGPDGTAFYDAAERRHLGDARALLWLLLLCGVVSGSVIVVLLARTHGRARSSVWRAVARAGAMTALAVLVVGVIGIVAFEPLFTAFHQVFFPAGGWSFDPSTQRLVQLYPFAFWQIAAAALGLLILVFAISAWGLGRSLATRDLER